MKGLMKKALVAMCAAGALTGIGCHSAGEHPDRWSDPCHMERYGSVARQEVITAFTPQVHNGRILDQTIWNYHFDAGKDTLNPSGMDKLDQIVRRRPEPDSRVFVATTRDITYNAEKPEEYGEARRELDAKRSQAIQKYLAAQTVGRPMQFDILIHDPADPGIAGTSARNAITSQRANYTGSLQGGPGGGGGQGGGGSSGGGSSGGASTGGGTQSPPR